MVKNILFLCLLALQIGCFGMAEDSLGIRELFESYENEEICGICLLDVVEEGALASDLFKCELQHPKYHKRCIEEWAKRLAVRCPICRAEKKLELELRPDEVLHDAIKRKNLDDVITALNVLMADEDAVNDDGDTPLIAAVKGSSGPADQVSYDIVAELLNNGADWHDSDDDGRDALQVAVENDNAPIVSLLSYEYSSWNAVQRELNRYGASLVLQEAARRVRQAADDLNQEGMTMEDVREVLDNIRFSMRPN